MPQNFRDRVCATSRAMLGHVVVQIRWAKTAHSDCVLVLLGCAALADVANRSAIASFSAGLSPWTRCGHMARLRARIRSLIWSFDPESPFLVTARTQTSSTLNAAKRVLFGSRLRKDATCACGLRSLGPFCRGSTQTGHFGDKLRLARARRPNSHSKRVANVH